MKKFIAVASALVLMAGMAWATYADEFGSATAQVHVKVVSNITVQPSVPIVDAGSVQSGDISTNVVFIVHANTEAVQMWVTATDLWKGDVPNPGYISDPTAVRPIPLKTSAGATISPEGANVLGGGSNIAGLPNSSNAQIGAFPAYESQKITFESMANGNFSHPVTVTVAWNLTDAQQAQGDYGARVMLSAMVMP